MLSAPPDWLKLAMTRIAFSQCGLLGLRSFFFFPTLNKLPGEIEQKIRERERAFHLIEKLILAVVGR